MNLEEGELCEESAGDQAQGSVPADALRVQGSPAKSLGLNAEHFSESIGWGTKKAKRPAKPAILTKGSRKASKRRNRK